MFALRPGVKSAAIRIDFLCAWPASCQGRVPGRRPPPSNGPLRATGWRARCLFSDLP